MIVLTQVGDMIDAETLERTMVMILTDSAGQQLNMPIPAEEAGRLLAFLAQGNAPQQEQEEADFEVVDDDDPDDDDNGWADVGSDSTSNMV